MCWIVTRDQITYKNALLIFSILCGLYCFKTVALSNAIKRVSGISSLKRSRSLLDTTQALQVCEQR